jgi:hypothetical protein
MAENKRNFERTPDHWTEEDAIEVVKILRQLDARSHGKPVETPSAGVGIGEAHVVRHGLRRMSASRALWLSIGHASAFPVVFVLAYWHIVWAIWAMWIVVPVLALSWFVWPIVLLRMGVRGWRLFVPLAFGFLTSGACLLLFLFIAGVSRQI